MGVTNQLGGEGERWMADEVIVRFYDIEGESTGPAISIPENATPKMLQSLVNELVVDASNPTFQFYICKSNGNSEWVDKGGTVHKLNVAETEGNRVEITKNVATSMKRGGLTAEGNVAILCVPQSAFKVRPISRCVNSLGGHTESILTIQYSPCGNYVASGSGDKTVRIWDMFTFTPLVTLSQPNHWVLAPRLVPRWHTIGSG